MNIKIEQGQASNVADWLTVGLSSNCLIYECHSTSTLFILKIKNENLYREYFSHEMFSKNLKMKEENK